MKLAPHFADSLSNFDLEKLDDSSDIIYGVDRDMRLAFFNERWVTMALENDADESFFSDWGLGSPVDEAFGDGLEPFYLEKFQRTKQTTEPWEYEYLCPSPDAIRTYQMRILPLEPEGWLVIHKKVVARSRYDDRDVPSDESYLDEDGLYHQCSHCCCFRRAGTEDDWDWVPDLFEDPPDRTSHGLCSTCFDYHYGQYDDAL